LLRDFAGLEPFRADCQAAGIYFFLPYIAESGIVDIVRESPLPLSLAIGGRQATLSMLALKLIGNDRLSRIRKYDADQGFGLFAGLRRIAQAQLYAQLFPKIERPRAPYLSPESLTFISVGVYATKKQAGRASPSVKNA